MKSKTGQIFLALVLAGSFDGYAQPVSLDPSFNPGTGIHGVQASVWSLAVQLDEKVLIGGAFSSVNGVPRNGIARLNSDGSLDPTFNPGAGTGGVFPTIFSLVTQPDGRILIAGAFSTVNGVPQNRIGRLNADGSPDTNFIANVGPESGGLFTTIALQPDGKIIVAGNFAKVNEINRDKLARLNTDGSLDASFDAGPVIGGVRSVAVQSDGKVIIGGPFFSVNGLARTHVARLNADSSLDTGFDPVAGPNFEVNSVAVQGDGKVFIGGWFTSVNGVSRNRIARLNEDGSLDNSFDPGTGADGSVWSVSVQPSGDVFIGGNFLSVNGNSRGGVARLHGDGSLDTRFNSDVGARDVDGNVAVVDTIAVQADGNVIIGGDFAFVDAYRRNGIARLFADSIINRAVEFTEPTYSVSEGSGTVRLSVRRLGDSTDSLTVNCATSDGSASAGADYIAQSGTLSFSRGETNKTITIPILDDGLVEGDETVNLILNNPTGGTILGVQYNVVLTIQDNEIPVVVDASFDAGTIIRGVQCGEGCEIGYPGGDVYSIGVQADGKVIIGGDFATVNNVAVTNIARLNPDGSVDTAFIAWTDRDAATSFDAVRAVVIQTDGKVLLGGGFTTVNGATRSGIARLNNDGSLDAGFNVAVDGPVSSVTIQTDEKVIIGGLFFYVNGVGRTNTARLNSDGSLDATFDPSSSLAADSPNDPESGVKSMAVQSDGRILFGGGFVSTNGAYYGLVRLHTDGSLDTGFNTRVKGRVSSVALQPDRKAIIGGQLYESGTDATFSIGRLNLDGSLDSSFQRRIDFVSGHAMSSLAVQPDGKLFVVSTSGDHESGYWFTIARLNTDGSLDRSFPARFGRNYGAERPFAVALQADGRVLVGGHFTTLYGASRSGIARLYSDNAHLSSVGFTATNYNVSETAGIVTVSVERIGDVSGTTTIDYATSDGTATAGQDYITQTGTLSFGPLENRKTFSIPILDDDLPESDEILNVTLKNPSSGSLLGVQSRSTITILDNERPGSLDTGFNAGGGDPGDPMAVQRDGKIISITYSNGVGLRRLNPDGSADPSFGTSSVSGGVTSIIIQPDGKVIIAGTFSKVDGIDRDEIARLKSDGSIDTNFYPRVSADTNRPFVIYSVALQADGNILIGGNFDLVDGIRRPGIARLNSDGFVDSMFNPTLGNDGNYPWIFSLGTQPDGKVLISGGFTSANSLPRKGFARLNADGSLDTSFDPNKGTFDGGTGYPSGIVSVVAQNDGKVLTGGYFHTSYNGVEYHGIARLNADGSLDSGFSVLADSTVQAIALQSDGKVLIGGTFSSINRVSRNGIARLNPDGSLDTGFDPGSGAIADYGDGSFFPVITSVVLQSDGKILIGGAISSVNGIQHDGIARLNGDFPLEFFPFARPANRPLRLTLASQSSKVYVLQASTDLINWIPLSTNTASGYTLDLEDTNAARFSERFYRAVTTP